MQLSMLAIALSAPAAPSPGATLPATEERLEAESLRELGLESAVPMWPDLRPFRHRSPEGVLIGLAFGAVSGALVASVLPDRAVLAERRFHTLSPCQKMVAAGLAVGCL